MTALWGMLYRKPLYIVLNKRPCDNKMCHSSSDSICFEACTCAEFN